MKKLLNKKGFTLMEMMIVIAIIVILVAIAVPTFSGSLDKANKATDAANLRNAKSAIAAIEFENGFGSAEGMFFDISKGELVSGSATSVEKGSCTNHGSAVIQIVSGEATWVSTDASKPISDDFAHDCDKDN